MKEFDCGCDQNPTGEDLDVRVKDLTGQVSMSYIQLRVPNQ
jgi:hypothetical protein